MGGYSRASQREWSRTKSVPTRKRSKWSLPRRATKDVMNMMTDHAHSLLFPEDKERQQILQKTRAYLTNPYVRRDGSLVNPYLDYQGLLDKAAVRDKVKRYITEATGLTPTVRQNTASIVQQNTAPNKANETSSESSSTYGNSGNVDGLSSAQLGKMDIASELPKLSEAQISKIISSHFGNSKVISPSDAAGIKAAQDQTGMSALAILGIGALESGYGTSQIANNTGNLWGYGATNINPAGNAHKYGPVSGGASQYASEFMKDYYNGYGAKSIYAAGTGNNPAGKGYAYYDNGTINSKWADDVSSIMSNFCKTLSDSGLGGTSIQIPNQDGTSVYANQVGKRIANTTNYSNDAATGQCVWYVRGRMKEKLGKDTGAIGNANQMYYNAPDRTKVSASAANLRPNMLVSYQNGTSAGGSKYGHVIYVEDVVGNTVYYTEGGSGYHQNGTDGVVKTATRDQIMNGVNSNGTSIGSNVIGFIDLNKL